MTATHICTLLLYLEGKLNSVLVNNCFFYVSLLCVADMETYRLFQETSAVTMIAQGELLRWRSPMHARKVPLFVRFDFEHKDRRMFLQETFPSKMNLFLLFYWTKRNNQDQFVLLTEVLPSSSNTLNWTTE